MKPYFIVRFVKNNLYTKYISMSSRFEWGREYFQENTEKNFKEREVKEVIASTKLQLEVLKNDVLNNNGTNREIRWWDENSLNTISEDIDNFYRIEHWKVVFQLDDVANYLEMVSKRLSWKEAPTYTELSNEKIFWGMVLALQIALETINRRVPFQWTYDIWVINGKLKDNQEMIRVLKDFQRDNGLQVDWKPWKWTIAKVVEKLKEVNVLMNPKVRDVSNIPNLEELTNETVYPRNFEGYTSWESLTWEQRNTISRILWNWRSPVTVDMVQDSCRTTWVPVEYLLAFMQNDSRVGTMGLWARTHNPWNVGNTWRGKKDWGTRERGVQACADNLKKRIDAYRTMFNDKSPTVSELATGIGPRGRRFFWVYMVASTGPRTVTNMVNTWKRRLSA